MATVAYDPNNSVQQKFLRALALGETGNAGLSAVLEGVGGSNLSGSSYDQYGFPQWQGEGSSHAAGIFQFEPSTWDSLASTYNLNFGNATDQQEGAWYLAQDTYAQNTGGKSLIDALNSGDYGSIQSALSGVWPSVTGNQANPQGLAAALQSGAGADLSGSGSSSSSSSSSGSGGILADVENWFTRFGLIAVGSVIVILALYFILKKYDVIPPISSVAKAA